MGQPQGLTVTGVGEAKATPDVARTNIGVEVRADAVEQATVESNRRMDAIIAAMRKLGIADRDLRSHSFSISFEQMPEPPAPAAAGRTAAARQDRRDRGAGAAPAAPAAPLVRGFYRASNMLEVTIRDLAKAGQVLQAATDAGANNVWGITFELEDDKPLLAKARAEAVADAKRNAQALAELARHQARRDRRSERGRRSGRSGRPDVLHEGDERRARRRADRARRDHGDAAGPAGVRAAGATASSVPVPVPGFT